jgi:hypothetical protein
MYCLEYALCKDKPPEMIFNWDATQFCVFSDPNSSGGEAKQIAVFQESQMIELFSKGKGT